MTRRRCWCPERRARAERPEIRLWPRPMRSLHRHRPKASDPVVHDAGPERRRCGNHHSSTAGLTEKPHPIRRHSSTEQPRQCGFCLSGVLTQRQSARRNRTPKPTDEQITRHSLASSCRCFPHARMIAAVKRYAEGRRYDRARLTPRVLCRELLRVPAHSWFLRFTPPMYSVGGRDFSRQSSQRGDGWLAINERNTVTAYRVSREGQGLFTAQTQLVAEELCVEVNRVKLIQCVTGTTPDQGVTSGAQSHPQNFNHDNLALAAATAREALLQMAAKQWGMPVERLTAGNGVVHSGTRTITYGELVGGKKFNLALTRTPSARYLANGPCSQSGQTPRHARDGDGHSSTCTTCACPAWCTDASSVRQRWVQLSRAR